MKCEVCRDLLPMYIDRLTSEVTNQEIELHMERCEKCRKVYEDMSSAVTDELKEELQVPKKEEIDYLKKFRRGWKLFVASGIWFIFMFVAGIYAMGVPLVPSSDEVELTCHEEEGMYYIKGEWSGNALSDVRGITSAQRVIYAGGERIEVENVHRIEKLLLAQNPFDSKRGSSVVTGFEELPTKEGMIVRDVFVFSDKEIVFENGKRINTR